MTENIHFPEIDGFDAIIGNPPFTPMKFAYEIIEQCLFKRLNETGKVVSILPWNFIINSSKRARDYFPHIMHVVNLPRTVFTGSRIQCAIFILSVAPFFGPALLENYSEVGEQ